MADATNFKQQIKDAKTLKELDLEIEKVSNELLKISTGMQKATKEQIESLEEKKCLLNNELKAEKKKLEIHSGMKSLAFEIEKSIKKQNTMINDGLTLKIKQIMIEQVLNKNKTDQGKIAKVAWEAQKRLNGEIAQGVIIERTRTELMSEYLSGLNLQNKTDLTKDQLESVTMYLNAIGGATEKWAKMSAKDLSILNEKNEILQEMGQRVDSISESIKTTINTISALWSDPRIAGSIFGLEVFKKLKGVGESMTDILDTGVGLQNVTGKIFQNINGAWFSSLKYGANYKEIAEATTGILDEMGSIEHLTEENVAGTVKLTKLYNMSSGEAAKLTKELSHISHLTGKTNEELRLSVAEMASLGKVAPTKVFEDLAGNAEAVAKWLDKSGMNMTKLSVSSRQLGLSMSDTLSITEGMLDFESSIEKQMQASVMTGKSFNFEQARSLAFAGKHNEALKSIVSQLGTEHEFMRMNAYKRQAMADMLGTSVDNLKEMIINQNKLGKETGKFSALWEEIYGRAKGTFSFMTKDNIIMFGSFVSSLKNLVVLGKMSGSFKKISGSFKKMSGLFPKFKEKSEGILPTGYKYDKLGKLHDTPSEFTSESVLTKQIDKSGGKSGITGWIKSWDGVKWGHIAKIAASLAVIGIAIYGFGKIISTLPTDISQYIAAGAMLVGLVGSIWAISEIAKGIEMKSVLRGALAMAIIGTSLIPFAFALKLLENVNWKTLAIVGTALVGITAAVMGLGALMSSGIGALVFGAGIVALISLSGALLMFGVALNTVAKNADGVNYLASSLSLLAQSMQELGGIGSSINNIKPVLKTIHQIETVIDPKLTKTEARMTTNEITNQTKQLTELIEQIKLLRKDVQKGMQIDGKKMNRELANVTGM